MDWHSITGLAQGQGTVFWAAGAAVSLGLTLLVVALGQALRQQLRRGRARARVASPPETAVTPPARLPDAMAAYAASSRTAAAPGDPDREEGSLALLLRRLQQAGDRLEEIAGDLDVAESQAAASSLKSDLQDVEYVFRASGS
ncbi:MAG: hypothetical protein R3D98_14445 [Candidatus Krumholzibacteriia bacterium]